MNSSDGSECGYKVGKLHTCNVIKEVILQKETPKRAWSSMESSLQRTPGLRRVSSSALWATTGRLVRQPTRLPGENTSSHHL